MSGAKLPGASGLAAAASSQSPPRLPSTHPDRTIATIPALPESDNTEPTPAGNGASSSATSQKNGSDEDRHLVSRMAGFRTHPLSFLREISLHVSGQGWRAYDDPVGQPVFYAGFTEDMKSAIVGTPMLRGRVRGLAEQRVRVEEGEGLLLGQCEDGSGDDDLERRRRKRKAQIEGQLWEVVEDWTDKLICKMESRRFVRGAYYMVTQLLTRAYHQGIHVSAEEVIKLKETARVAQQKGQSIVFLPSHRTHIDYVSLQLICFRLGLTLPVVVAGDNLNVPVLGPFLQHVGAMWIRRSFGDDQLYSTLVQSYMDTMLQKGYNLECFIEGGRSRTGKLLPPKFGILSFILDSIVSGRVDDCLIVPVSAQYDKVIEVDTYISELLGQPKQKESFTEFLSASSVLSLKLGRVDVRFHDPWSLRDFVNEQKSRYGPVPDTMPQDLKVRMLRTLGYKVLSDINQVSVIMPTALIGTVLLTLRGRGVGLSELIRRVDWLSDRVRAQGGRCAHFGNLPTGVVVERGLDVLGPQLVGVLHGLSEKTYYAVDRFQLSFYRNMTIHLFILQAIVSAGMYTRVKQGGGPENQRIAFAELRDQVGFLSQLFRGEFIFPTEGLDANLQSTLAGLERDDVVKVTRSPSDHQAVNTIEIADSERERGRENFDFYCFLIWPTIESFWLAAVSLLMLTPPLTPPSSSNDSQEDTSSAAAAAAAWIDAKKFENKAQLLGKTLYHQGDLSYFEAVNKQTLQNAYSRFEEEGILQKRRAGKDSKTSPTIKLAREWLPTRDAQGKVLAKGRLWDFSEMISQSRREGKNRRDGATVKTRVLRLVEWAGEELFAEHGASAAAAASTNTTSTSKAVVGQAPGAKGQFMEDEEDLAEKYQQRKRKNIKAVARL